MQIISLHQIFLTEQESAFSSHLNCLPSPCLDQCVAFISNMFRRPEILVNIHICDCFHLAERDVGVSMSGVNNITLPP